jgi:hypothetical protein
MIDFLFWLFLVLLLTALLIAIVAYCIGVAEGLDNARLAIRKHERNILYFYENFKAVNPDTLDAERWRREIAKEGARIERAKTKRRRVLLWPVDSVRATMQQRRERSERINKIRDELL